MDTTEFRDLPSGFGMMLASHPEAMSYFSSLPAPERQRVVDQSRTIHSRNEMRALVQELCGAQKKGQVPFR